MPKFKNDRTPDPSRLDERDPRTLKCTRCSAPIGARDSAAVVDGDWFHASCWRIIVAERAIVTSAAVNGRARRTLDSARTRLGAMRPGTSEPAAPGIVGCVACGGMISRVDDLVLHGAGVYHTWCVPPRRGTPARLPED